MENAFYYKLEEAEQLKQTYTSWIGREAHVGKGEKQTLQSIKILSFRSPMTAYRVEFIFANGQSLNTAEFLFRNGLVQSFKNFNTISQKSDSTV